MCGGEVAHEQEHAQTVHESVPPRNTVVIHHDVGLFRRASQAPRLFRAAEGMPVNAHTGFHDVQTWLGDRVRRLGDTLLLLLLLLLLQLLLRPQIPSHGR